MIFGYTAFAINYTDFACSGKIGFFCDMVVLTGKKWAYVQTHRRNIIFRLKAEVVVMKKSTKHLITGVVLMAAYLIGYTIIQFVLFLNGADAVLSVLDFSYPFDVVFGVILFTVFLKSLNSNKGAVSIKKAAIGLVIVISVLVGLMFILHLTRAYESLYTAIMSSEWNIFDRAAAWILDGNGYLLSSDEFTLSSILYSRFMPDAGLIIRAMIILGTAQISYIIHIKLKFYTDIERQVA